MKKGVLSKLLVASGLLLTMSSTALATELENYIENDVTPPWGRISINSALKVNGVNYVESEKVTVNIYAADDMSQEDIKYYLSLEPIEDVGKIENWSSYEDGEKAEIVIDNLDTTNTIYAVFKDKNGNTSHIYTSDIYKQTITFDMNTTDPVEFDTTVIDNTRIHGAPYLIPEQAPKREGYYFIGWSTDQIATNGNFYAGDIVPADIKLGTDEATATLYAVWSTDVTKLPLLADTAEIGDYVDYPVVYDNVISYTNKDTGLSFASALEGWRVIGKEDDGTVNLISAGIPITFYNWTNQAGSIPALTDNFITTPFGVGEEKATYRNNGFGPYLTLKEVFTNKYTQMKEDGETPKVRSVVQEDILKITGDAEIEVGYGNGLNDAKYGELFKNAGLYWIASPYPADSHNLRIVNHNGYAGDGKNIEYGVRPVVSLKPDVRADGTNMIGVWNIEI